MRWFKALSLALILAGAPTAIACPNCKDAVESGMDEDGNDPLREARAYNNSIYFMLAVPYSILATGGVVFYRQNRAMHRLRSETA